MGVVAAMTWKRDSPPSRFGKWQQLVLDFVDSGDECWSTEFDTESQARDRRVCIQHAADAMHARGYIAAVRVCKHGKKVSMIMSDEED